MNAIYRRMGKQSNPPKQRSNTSSLSDVWMNFNIGSSCETNKGTKGLLNFIFF